MGLMVTRSVDDYRAAIRDLYPPGEWWDKQFADSSGELSRYVEALAGEAHRTQERIVALLDEAYPDRTVELVAEYEAMFGLSATGDLAARRSQLLGAFNTELFKDADWDRIAAGFGCAVSLQRQEGFVCGLSRCGDRLWGVAARCYLVFVVSHAPGVSAAQRRQFEKAMRDSSPPMYYLEFQYQEVSTP